jgi:DivIVA domain-containing protein
MNDQDLVPLSDDPPPSGFDVVLRGYDRRQVDDYLDRVEVALTEADDRHAEDAHRLSALEATAADLHERLGDAERRAAGLPEAASVTGDRIAAMLRLAEEEAAAIRTAAREEADSATAARDAELDQREQELRRSAEQADQATLQAQKDAEAIRAAARRDAEELRAEAAEHADGVRQQADEDVRLLHEAGRQEAAAMTAEARRQVEELSRQRDAIAAQLQNLRDTLSGAVGPLSAPAAGSLQADDATQAFPQVGEPRRAGPGA